MIIEVCSVSTLLTYDTELSADSAEWCLTEGYENILAIGTYQVDKSDEETFSDDQRHGCILLFEAEDDLENRTTKFKLLKQIKTGAILDMKWSPVVGEPYLATCTSSGQVVIYDLSQDMNVKVQTKIENRVILSIGQVSHYRLLFINWPLGGMYMQICLVLLSCSPEITVP